MRTATLVLIIAARLLIGTPVAQASPPRQETTIVYTVRSGDTLSSIAARYGTTYQAIMRANNLSDTLIVPGQRLAIPQGEDTTALETPPASADDQEASYVVRAGDSLWSVAVRYGISVAELKQANGIVGNAIVTGQVLRIPAPQATPAVPLLATPAPQAAPTVPLLATPAPQAAPTVPLLATPASSPCGATYTVRRGDTLSAIAAACATTISALTALNDVPNGNVIRVGQVLKIPGPAQPAAEPLYTLWFPIPTTGFTLIVPSELLDSP